jgi:hypothetical protein
LTPLPDNLNKLQREPSMKRVTLALATLLLALAVMPAADARVVQPPWVVVRWAYGDCKIWRNDINAPWGPGWQSVAYANTYPEARAKMEVLYARRWCL